MRCLIDTNVAILLRDGEAAILDRLQTFSAPALLSSVSRVELESGVYRDPQLTPILRPRLAQMLDVLVELPFGPPEAAAYGAIVQACGFSRTRIIDRMIAAQAISAGTTLVTLNARDFRDIPGLAIEDWSA